jgi:thiazole synthase ThiGH ThiG subunit
MPRRIAEMLAAILVAGICAPAQAPFAPLDAWKAAVVNGDQAALAKLYSAQHSAQPGHFQVGHAPIALKDEWAFWAGMKRNMA